MDKSMRKLDRESMVPPKEQSSKTEAPDTTNTDYEATGPLMHTRARHKRITYMTTVVYMYKVSRRIGTHSLYRFLIQRSTL